MSGTGGGGGVRAEILELVGRLKAIEARLVQLTGGQVDALIGPSGERHLLPQAQADLMRSVAAFHKMFAEAAVGIVSTDAEARIQQANPVFCALLDATAESLAGTDFLDLLAEGDAFGCRTLIAELRAGQRPHFVTEVRFEERDARRIWVRLSVSALHDADGGTAGFVAIVEDITERKAAEAANLRLTDQLRATLASISDAFVTLDAEFRFTRVNEHAAQLCGQPAAALLGTSAWDQPCFAPDGPFAAALRLAAADGKPVTEEGRLGTAGPWLELRAYPSTEGLTIVLHDIAARRQQEEQLRLMEASLARLNDLVIITTAPDQRIVFVNDAFVDRTGYRREHAIGRTPRILQGPRTQRAELDRIRVALRANQPVRAELLNYSATGEEFWIDLAIAPIAAPDGRVTHFVAVERDVTERRRIQAALEQQAALLERVQDAIILRRLDGRIEFWNGGAERLYGWSAEEAVGRTTRDLIYQDPADFDRLHTTVLTEERWSGQVTKKHRDGRVLVVQSSLSLLRDEEGRPQGVMAFNTDITEKLEIEQRMQQSQRLEVVGQLTGGIAHDFNNLLTVIVGNAEMLSDSLDPADPARQMAEMMLGAAERGAALTGQLLAFSRRQKLQPRIVDVNQLLGGLGQMMRRTLGEHIAISILLADGLWPARIDPLQLENAVMNLCINARDAMPAGGRLTIETANVHLGEEYAETEAEVIAGRYVMIAVTDTGTGMPPATLARAFEPYYTTKDVGRGSGLGLSMVFGFLKQSGGHVKLYSEVGIGTVVKMYLPSEPALAGDAAADRAANGALRGGHERLLVVEDDAAVRQHVAAQLRQLGYQVVEAADGPSALQVLQTGAGFDLLFTDFVMPGGMNGSDLAAAARRLRPGLRVLFSSGYTEGAGLQGRLLPGTFLLPKPYRRRELAEKVRAALESEPQG